jgi:hypothetical protein
MVEDPYFAGRVTDEKKLGDGWRPRVGWNHHWITPLAFMPFALMLIVHRLLGLSDAMLAAPNPGQPYWPIYNIAMVMVFYLGIAGYLAHTFWLSARGWNWVLVKCSVLVIAWIGMVVALESLNN